MTDTDVQPPPLLSVQAARIRNSNAGHNFFDADTLRFFSSRISSKFWPLPDGGGLFITSERSGFDLDSPRRWTVRRINREATSIDEVGEFLQHDSMASAVRAAKTEARRLSYEGVRT